MWTGFLTVRGDSAMCEVVGDLRMIQTRCFRLWGLSILLVIMCFSTTGVVNAESVGLVDAVKRMDAAAGRTLLDQGVAVNRPTADGSTALHWAVHRGDLELVDILLKAGADVSAANRYAVEPLSLAALNGDRVVIERLLDAGADANTTLPEGETVLMTVARTGEVAAIRALVAAGANVNARDDVHGQSALMWAAAKGHARAIHVLIEAGGDVHARTEIPVVAPVGYRSLFSITSPTGFTPLIFAVRHGHLEATRALLDAGADPNDVLSDGQSVLVVAAANANWEAANYLLDRGADPNLAAAGWNALHQTVRTRRMNVGFGAPGPISSGSVDSIDVIKKLLDHGAHVNARMTRNGMKDGQRNRLNRLGATAFFLAAKVTDVEAMKVLIDGGADPMIPSVENTTALMVAAGLDIWNPGEDGGSLPGQEEEVLEAVKMCVELGHDVNAVNDLGETALHGAAFRGANIVVEYLVEQGATLDPKDQNGWTPWAIANGFSYSDFYKAQKHTAELLVQYLEEKNLPTGEPIPGSVCFDCLQTRLDQAQAVRERDKRLEDEFRATLSRRAVR